ncbi:hypothetical protein N9137_03220 [Pseudomonadales bacterium]|nr:hypothetical protein [Pseudomonadales bacterium]
MAILASTDSYGNVRAIAPIDTMASVSGDIWASCGRYCSLVARWCADEFAEVGSNGFLIDKDFLNKDYYIMFTVKGFSELFNGRYYQSEIKNYEENALMALNYVMVTGRDDNKVSFYGAICDNALRGEIFIDPSILTRFNSRCDFDTGIITNKCNYVKLPKIFADFGVITDYSWTIDADFPHEKFDIYKNGTKFSQGIVFDLGAL